MLLMNAVYVEDEPDIAKLLQNGLGVMGITVKVYPQPEDLLANMAQPDVTEANLFIIDIRMPRMTGLELAARLRSEGDQRPILMVSAYNPPSRRQLQALQAKFLPKPFDLPVLLETVREMVD